jgi:hypothetical protein
MAQLPSQAVIEALQGHQFAGGSYRVEHWENVLLTGCTGGELLADALVHPIILFHLPITGAGTSITQMFALGKAESDLSILIESYHWQFFSEIEEEVDYQVNGHVASSERCLSDEGNTYDRLQFVFEVNHPNGEAVARSTITWHYTRDTL